MRKVVAGTMVAAALAWAHGVRAEDAKTDQKKAQERQTQQGSSSAATEPGHETGMAERTGPPRCAPTQEPIRTRAPRT